MGYKNKFSDFTAVKVAENQEMNKKTSIGVGGKARYYAEADSLYGINNLIIYSKDHHIPYKIIGNGTNVIFSDSGYDGLIISTRKLKDIFFKRDLVMAMAGATVENLIKFSLNNSLGGIEVLSGIPATVGGAVVMNAGAFGHNISEYINTVTTIDKGKLKVYDKWDCGFSYRKSRFQNKKEVVVSVTFNLKNSDRETIKENINNYLELRKKCQPSGRTCGSVFKNPEKYSAGALIDRANLKGINIGGASISEKHGNFILAKPNTKASDVYQLVQHIKEEIKEKYGIVLFEEVEFIGDF